MAIPLPGATLPTGPHQKRRHHPARPRRSLVESGANALFLTHLETIDDVIDALMRRHGWDQAGAEDFRSWAYLRLLKDDSKALRRFSGRSSIRTYLVVVLSNLLRDYRNARLGRWRPSASSVRLGRWAVELDRLINRDRFPRAEAVRVLVARADCDATEVELRELSRQVPARPRARPVGLDALENIAGTRRSDAGVVASERDEARCSVLGKLERALRDLDPEDQVIVRLRFFDGLTLADVARTLGLPAKPLYRRLSRCLQGLRVALEARGLDAAEVRTLLGAKGAHDEMHSA